MSNIVEVKKNEISFSNEELETLKKTVAKDATNAELALFVSQCKRTRLDPFSKQIYFVKDEKGRITIMTSIDGLRLIAERSEKYQGQTEVKWCAADGVWRDVWLSNQPPVAAKVGVYKEGFREPLYSVALLSEYQKKYPDGNLVKGPWTTMPTIMLAKVAESLALRKAFPNEMGGVYTDAEITFDKQQEKIQHQENKILDAPKNTLSEKEVKEVIKMKIDPQVELTPGNYVVKFGKHKDKKIGDMALSDIDGYIAWLKKSSKDTGKPLGKFQNEFIENGELYLFEQEKEFSKNQMLDADREERMDF